MMIKSKHIVFILIICILFSVAAVSANDNQTVTLNHDVISNDGIGVNDDVELMGMANRSYDDFYDDIKDCTDTFEIKSNYVYGESDNKKLLEFNQSNLVINGNNHVIDGFNTAKGFVFKNYKVNITINDLTFTNCNQAIVIDSGNVTLNNVNFTGNLNSGSFNGIVSFKDNGNLILDNCNFNSNINSTLISIMFGNVAIYNSHFYNAYGDVDGLIIVNRNSLVIENSTFENLSSKYGGSINFKGDYLSVKNSTFRNTHAMTGGAIIAKFFAVSLDPYDSSSGVKTRGDMVIDSCKFVNVSSVHNGGAIYFDLDSGSQGYKKTLGA